MELNFEFKEKLKMFNDPIDFIFKEKIHCYCVYSLSTLYSGHDCHDCHNNMINHLISSKIF